MTITLIVLVALLAYANGSNDNSKGVATLVGYGLARPLPALLYATVATAVGGAFSFWFAPELLKRFSGGGLFAGGTVLPVGFYIAVLIGAFGWVIFATYTALPVSTTHAILGALIGAGLVSFGRGQILWQPLGMKFVLPLLLSPVLSLVIVYLLAWPIVWMVRRAGSACVCAVKEERTVAFIGAGAGDALVAERTSGVTVLVDNAAACADRAPAMAVTAPAAANAVHWLSGGWISFARGWNDSPKIAALCLIALPQSRGMAFLVVAAGMALGGLISGRKVLDTLARKLTPLPLPESLTASLTTAALVSAASFGGYPVSTTHIATGAIIGGGLKNDPGAVKWRKVTEVLLSWVITLPAAALIAAGAEWVLR